jgi:hypothetical protein
MKLNRLFTIDSPDIVSISRMLSRRTSSRPTDETLAIAPLFGVNTKFLHKHDEDRFCEFWRLMKKVPEEIIFTADQRLGREGFSWAPKTLMNPVPDVFIIHKPDDGG